MRSIHTACTQQEGCTEAIKLHICHKSHDNEKTHTVRSIRTACTQQEGYTETKQAAQQSKITRERRDTQGINSAWMIGKGGEVEVVQVSTSIATDQSSSCQARVSNRADGEDEERTDTVVGDVLLTVAVMRTNGGMVMAVVVDHHVQEPL